MKYLKIVWHAITAYGPIGWFRNLFYIVGYYRTDMQLIANAVDSCRERVDIVEGYVKKVTKVHADVDTTSEGYTKIVVIGQYRGKDHVQIFSLRPGSIDMLIDQLKDMQRYAEVGYIDAPEQISTTMKRSLLI
jgi:hypothetical protein